MPAKGQQQTDETKKKISEALFKGGAKETPVTPVYRSPEGQRLFDEYTSNKNKTLELRGIRDALMAKRSTLGRTKKSRAQRAEINKKLKEISTELKQKQAERAIIRDTAKANQRLRKAEVHQKQLQLKEAKLNILDQKIRELINKTKSESAKTRLSNTLDRIAYSFDNIKKQNAKVEAIISSKGKKEPTEYDIFANEVMNSINCFSEQKPYAPWRKLTLFEERANLETVNNTYNELESDLENAIIEQMLADFERTTPQLKKKIEEGDIAGIAAITLLSSLAISRILKEYAKLAQEKGKKAASIELKVERPLTPLQNTQMTNMEADIIAESIVSDVDNKTKDTVRVGLMKGVAVGAIVASAVAMARKRSSQLAQSVTSLLVGEHFNLGRSIVFEKYPIKIKAYQRSEVLDSRTCNICLSMDKRVVKADDPFSKLDLVHSNCRGLWVPILQDEQIDTKVGIPKSIQNSFETVGGVPVANSFTQLKKAINDKSNEAAQREIENRISGKK